jgi:hypothetical protein
MTPQELLERALQGALIINPVTGPVALPLIVQEEMRKRTAAQAAQKPEEPEAPEAPEAPQAESGPGGYGDPGVDYSPEQLPLPTGGVDLNNLLPYLIESQGKSFERREEAAREFYPERTQIDLEAWKAREAIARQNALERMREKTKRDKELKVIDAWTAVTQSEIQRDTAMGLGMMNLSATLGMPNPNVLNASANALAAGAQGFSGGAKSVF